MNRASPKEIEDRLFEAGFTLYSASYCGSCGCWYNKYKLEGTIWKVEVCTNKGTFFLKKAGRALVGKKVDKFNEVFEKYIQEITQSKGS